MEAIQQVNENSDSYSLIFMDIDMPIMNGLMVLNSNISIYIYENLYSLGNGTSKGDDESGANKLGSNHSCYSLCIKASSG